MHEFQLALDRINVIGVVLKVCLNCRVKDLNFIAQLCLNLRDRILILECIDIQQQLESLDAIVKLTINILNFIRIPFDVTLKHIFQVVYFFIKIAVKDSKV